MSVSLFYFNQKGVPSFYPFTLQAANWLKQTKETVRPYAHDFTHSVNLALLSFKINLKFFCFCDVASTGLLDKPGFVDRCICFI